MVSEHPTHTFLIHRLNNDNLYLGVVTGIAIIAVIQHHTGAVNPGLVGLAISYALGITGKLSGLVSGLL